jgi:hypothetical protein
MAEVQEKQEYFPVEAGIHPYNAGNLPGFRLSPE